MSPLDVGRAVVFRSHQVARVARLQLAVGGQAQRRVARRKAGTAAYWLEFDADAGRAR